MYGVNPANEANHRSYVGKLKLRFPLIVDSGGQIARAFRSGWSSIIRRTVYVVSPTGRIAYSRRGSPPVDEILDAIDQWPGAS